MNGWSEDLISVGSARTLDGLFAQRVHRSPDRDAYRYYDRAARDWCTLSWREMAQRVGCWQSALAAESLAPGDRVAVLLRNCPEWVQFEQASLGLGLVVVPLYTDDRPENAAYILRDADCKLLLIQDAGRWKKLAPAIVGQDRPRRVVIMESGRDAERLAREDPRAVTAAAWLPGPGQPLRRRRGEPAALATIVYTSGTTGRPKGVMLSHHNILAVAHGCLTILDCYQQDLFLSFLPLSHTLERTGGYYLPMMAGSTVAFARSVSQLAEDLQSVRPTVLIAVPRIFERVYARLQDRLRRRAPLARALFRTAIAVGWRHFEATQGRAGWHPALPLWPLLRRGVAVPLQQRLGGRLRIAVSGGAALSPAVARPFISLGIPLLQGYGLTETSPVVSVNPLDANRPGSVGVPLRGVQVRIGRDDELLVKGPGVMLGYWNNHAATAQMIDADGWLHTGDQARIEDDHIYITGRLKDILVLSNGENVSPVDMEMAMTLDPLFEQVMVVGEGRSFLGALVVLSADLWPGLAQEYGLDPAAMASLKHDRLQADLLARIRLVLAGFPGYAKIRRLVVLLEPWTVENGLLTPTLKIKRAQVLEKYRREVAALYSEGPS